MKTVGGHVVSWQYCCFSVFLSFFFFFKLEIEGERNTAQDCVNFVGSLAGRGHLYDESTVDMLLTYLVILVEIWKYSFMLLSESAKPETCFSHEQSLNVNFECIGATAGIDTPSGLLSSVYPPAGSWSKTPHSKAYHLFSVFAPVSLCPVSLSRLLSFSLITNLLVFPSTFPGDKK